MKEEYLWNKTGSDPEIERLENALKAFRYQEDEPPALPAKIFSLKKDEPRFSFKLVFALMAFTASAIIFAGVRFQLLNDKDDKTEIAVTSSEIVAPPMVGVIPDESSFDKQHNVGNAVVPAAVRAGRRDAHGTVGWTTTLLRPASFQKVSRKSSESVTAIKNQNKLTAENSKVKKPTVKLTKEESYAYNQLMLALSITNSKLKLVTDKIEGVEEQKAVPKIER